MCLTWPYQVMTHDHLFERNLAKASTSCFSSSDPSSSMSNQLDCSHPCSNYQDFLSAFPQAFHVLYILFSLDLVMTFIQFGLFNHNSQRIVKKIKKGNKGTNYNFFKDKALSGQPIFNLNSLKTFFEDLISYLFIS